MIDVALNPEGYALAREILGDDFISPEEIAIARGITYTDKRIARLKNTLPGEKTLEWLRSNDFILIAGSPCDMSLLDIHELERRHFYYKKGGWYTSDSEIFARNDKVTCSWLMLRKSIVPNSTVKTWNEQNRLLSDLETVPNIAEQVWGMTIYMAVRRVYLFDNVYTRTSSVNSEGDHVFVGNFGVYGFYVDDWEDSTRSRSFGIASSRK